MKNIIKKSLKQLLTDRYLLIVLVLFILVAIINSIIISLSIHTSELQLVSHYSAYGITHFYRDQWFYLVTFVLFQVIISILGVIICIKLFIVKDRSIAIMFAWVGIGTLIVGLITALHVLNVWTPL